MPLYLCYNITKMKEEIKLNGGNRMTKAEWTELDRDGKYEFCGGLMSIDTLDEADWAVAEKVGRQLVRLYDDTGDELGIMECNDAPSFFELDGGRYLYTEDRSVELDPETGEQMQH